MISTDLIVAVKDARIEHQRLKVELAVRREAFELKEAPLKQEVGNAGALLDASEATLRQAILDEYALTGNKAPAPGCGVRVLQKLEYPETYALDWAAERKIAIKLDKPLFERIMKDLNVKPDWLTVSEEPQATIATDLEKALAES